MLAGKTSEETYQENLAYCKSVSDKLSDAHNGRYYHCPECGETVKIDEDCETFTCECGFSGDQYDFDQCFIDELFGEIYDTEYYIGGDGEYRGVRLMIACGGPNVYIDTREREVQLYWWQDHARYYIDKDVCDAIDELYEDIYRSIRPRCSV